MPGGRGDDMIIARGPHKHLMFSHRAAGGAWSAEGNTMIPDVNSNVNAGQLPSGRVYLASNPCPNKSITGALRDPLVVSTSADGLRFDRAAAVMSCVALGGCQPRFAGRAKNPGPSYPQAVAVTEPASMAALYVVATNNKEDVVVARVPFSELDASLPDKADDETAAPMPISLRADATASWPAPTRLRVEGLEQQPPGLVVLSEQRPRFAFSHGRFAAPPRGLAQAAYRITVRSGAADSGGAAPVWDSGVVRSTNSSEIVYAGDPLHAFGAYRWSVAWLASDGNWSANASAAFELGPGEAEWTPAA